LQPFALHRNTGNLSIESLDDLSVPANAIGTLLERFAL
jgi:hypothetical protein